MPAQVGSSPVASRSWEVIVNSFHSPETVRKAIREMLKLRFMPGPTVELKYMEKEGKIVIFCNIPCPDAFWQGIVAQAETVVAVYLDK